MANTLFYLHALLCSTLFFSCFTHLSIVDGFTVDLIHRDSPLSPLYNPKNTHFDRLRNAFHRSTLRAAQFKASSQGTIQSTIVPASGEYLMNVSIGTPPVTILGIADTGSDLIWIQCQPCTSCFDQNGPIFSPDHSSTYNALSCESRVCESLRSPSCSDDGNVCQYTMSYGDKSFSTGDYSVDTFTFGSTTGRPVTVPKIVFGCGHDNEGTFNEFTSGIVGLGGDSLSLVNQLGAKVDGKFSYCLVPFKEGAKSSPVTSKINFGTSATVSGPGVVSTPLVSKSPKTYYYLTLESISVGNSTLKYKSSSESKSKASVKEGNIIIDSGTTLTLIPREFYDDLETALVDAIGAKRAENPQDAPFNLCYASHGNDFDAPTLTFHFAGADVVLPVTNTFVMVEKGLVCLTIVPAQDIAIFGNLSQMNFLVGYDLVNQKVSFKPTDCSKA